MFRFTETIMRELSACASLSYNVDFGYISLCEVIGIVAAYACRMLPDDGLCKPKHVGATIIILNDFNCLTIL